MNRSFWAHLGCLLVATTSATACAGEERPARTGGDVYVETAPPSDKVEAPTPEPPGGAHVWVRGHWHWNGRQFIWIQGHWEARRAGYDWVPGHWSARGRRWVWIAGHWRRR
jgi:hypothetical protein